MGGTEEGKIDEKDGLNTRRRQEAFRRAAESRDIIEARRGDERGETYLFLVIFAPL